jgi:hypothetical protein
MILGSRESDGRGAWSGLIRETESAVSSGNKVLLPSVCAVTCKEAAANNAMSTFFIRNHQFSAKLRKSILTRWLY